MKDYPDHMAIKVWKEEDRPREKFVKLGRSHLSDSELIAILLGSGSRNESALGLARRILEAMDNSLAILGKSSLEKLTAFKGVGQAKAVTVLAALELGRRRKYEAARDVLKINSSNSVFEKMQPLVGELSHEEFWILYLNNSNHLLQSVQLSKGGITGTVVDVRLAFRNALQLGAVSVILVHNHPSGSLKPSNADIEITNKMKRAGENLDIKVLDHLIVTEKAYFSFADEHLL